MIYPHIYEDTACSNFELELAFVTGVETPLSFTALINLHYGVEEVTKWDMENLHNKQGEVEGISKTVCT
jgi:hypothetical protein